LSAAAVDAVAFNLDMGWLRWANYAFVWLAVHQLGYLWRDGRLSGPRALWWAVSGLALLAVLVGFCGYPISMITVPGEPVSNSRPPTLALLCLGVFHAGLVLSVEAPARRWLRRRRVWAATVLVNGSIMTLYLWHATVMVLLVGLAYALGGIGLRHEPASAGWWATRPLWIAILAVGLAGFVSVFARYEQRAARPGSHPAAPAWQTVLGAVAVCLGLAAFRFGGVSDGGAVGLRLGFVLVTIAGAALVTGRGVLWRRAASAR
ncbi:MAG: acyltransferase, partial [Myxococcota bacterium]